MKKLRQRFERFCFANRNKGIPNLMLYLCSGAAVMALMSYIDPVSAILLSALVLKEGMSPIAVIGTALVLGAVIFCELPERKS